MHVQPQSKGDAMESHPVWSLEIVFTEDDRATRADVVLDVAGHHHHGWGRAKRDPEDRDVPVIGEEIAAARALIRLAHQLLGAAESDIEEIEQQPARVHS
jgi:hypothetical protein